MKYIMLEGSNGAIRRKVPIIFPPFMVHADVAKVLTDVLVALHGMTDVKIVSAGELDLAVDVHGRSSTLNIDSNPEDKATIELYRYMFGV